MSKHEGRISGRQLAARLQEATESHLSAHQAAAGAVSAVVVPSKVTAASEAPQDGQEGSQES